MRCLKLLELPANDKRRTLFKLYFKPEKLPGMICFKLENQFKYKLVKKYVKNSSESNLLNYALFNDKNLISWDIREDKLSFGNLPGCLEEYFIFYGMDSEKHLYDLLLREGIVNQESELQYIFTGERNLKKKICADWVESFLNKVLRETFEIKHNEIVLSKN